MELNQERQLEAAKLLKQMVVTLQQNIEDNKLSQDEIDSVIKEAVNYNGPVVVDCCISPDSNVLPMIPPGGSAEDIITTF